MKADAAKFIRALVERAAAPYRSVGRFAWHFARGKLAGDPVFAGLLRRALIPDNVRVLDIGCGQGLLASWLISARAMFDGRDGGVGWPEGWPPAPRLRSFHGIEVMARDVARAQQALGDGASFTVGDMRTTGFDSVDVAVILDVLHYVSFPAQDYILLRVRDALAPSGTLILRIGDSSGGLPFLIGAVVDHVVTFVRGHRNNRFYCRSVVAWKRVLTELGFALEVLPMNAGTPFSNILLIAKLAPEPTPSRTASTPSQTP